MSWAVSAVGGATLVSGYMSSRSASKASSKASAAEGEALAFEYEKYDDWKETYGDLQDNLSEYYNNVSPEYYAAVGVEKFNEEFQVGMQRISENFAKRGIDPDSTLAVSTQAQAELDAAETRASIRRDAPRQAREDQRGFLQIGLGQNPGSSLSSTLANTASNRASTANSAQNAAGNAWAAAIPAAGDAASALNTHYNPPAPTT